jgi:hypothetical protein
MGKEPAEPNSLPDTQSPKSPVPPDPARKQDRRLDEELEETFPASDPVPVRHET